VITMDTYGHLFPASNDRAKLEAGRHRSGAQADVSHAAAPRICRADIQERRKHGAAMTPIFPPTPPSEGPMTPATFIKDSRKYERASADHSAWSTDRNHRC
jgi:hypothetical protein